MLTKIDHIGIAVQDIDEAVKLYTEMLGLQVDHIENIAAQKARVAMIPVGESKVELLDSSDPDSVIGRFIEKKGEGIHHVAFGVNDIKQTLKELKEKGVPLIDQEPRLGADNTMVAFLHPKGTKILIELVEHHHH